MRLFAHELRYQLLLYTRSKELAFFTFMLPIILFVLLGSTYGKDRINGVRGSDFLEAGMLGYGLVSTAFAGLAILIVIRRETGILKRVRATPLTPTAYIGAVLTSTLIAFALNAIAMIAIGRGLFSVPLPHRWLSLVVVLLVVLLGLITRGLFRSWSELAPSGFVALGVLLLSAASTFALVATTQRKSAAGRGSSRTNVNQ